MTLLLAGKSEETMDALEKERLWDLLLHSEMNMTSRTHFFLIAEAMLVVAYGFVLGQNVKGAYAFSIGGVALSLTWLALQYVTINDLSKLSAKLKEVEISRHYLDWRAECKNFVITHEVLVIVIPILCAIGWFLVLAFNS